jgi:steroid delta-isomerase
MASPEQMTAAVHAYVEAFDQGDPDVAAALFAEDAVVEDPIGSPPHVGQAAIRAFYAASMQTGAKLILTGPPRLAPPHLAFPMQVRLNWQGRDMVIDVIDTWQFDASGKIRRMQAYFGPSNMADTSTGNKSDA